MANEKRIATTIIRTRPSLKAAAQAAAEADGRTLSSLIEKLLTEHLRETGRLPIADDGPK